MRKTQLYKDFDTGDYKIGASSIKQLLWYFISIFFFESRLIPFSSLLVFILRIFGSKIGKQVRIKPGVHIKYPWKLEVGDYSWLADCYIENLDWIKIGNNCCISQQAVLMTGNHNFKKASFDLTTAQIILEDGVWIASSAKVGPGVIAHSHAVLTMGSVTTKNLSPYGIYEGNPAKYIKDRIIS